MRDLDYKSLSSEIITRNNFLYEENREAWNRAIQKYPKVICYPKTAKEVIEALKFVKENKIKFRIRSGRHHYEGYSTGNDIFIIDVSKMNNIYVDEDNKTVKIDGGVRNRELYEALNSLGYPFPGGGCPTVGVIGFTLGGGWGYSSRLLGLGCDNLIEAELVNCDGDLLTLNNDVNKDLLWALKGSGGGNFGIVTSMTFKLPNKIEMATLINIDFNNIDIEEKIDIIEELQNTYKTLDRRMNLKTAIYNSQEKGHGIKMTGLFYGKKEEANKILQSIKSKGSKMYYNLEYMTVLDANRWIQDSHPDYEKYKSGGRFVLRDYNREEIKKIIEVVSERAEGSTYTAVSFYGLGGAVSDIEKNNTAFYYRNAKFIMGFQSVWEDLKYAEINVNWVKERFEFIKSITEGSFINFPIDSLDDYEKEYYGKNIVKLKEVKRKYDSNNTFNFEQSIKSI